MSRLTAIVIFMAVLIGLVFLWGKYRNQVKENDQIQQNLISLKSEVKKYKDSSGRWQAEAISASGSIETLKITHSDQLRKLEEEYEIKLKNVKSSVSTVTETVYDTVIDVRYLADSSITFSDSTYWHRVSGTIKNGRLTLGLKVMDSLSFVVSRTPRLFKPDILKVTAKSYNPNTKINGLEAILVDDSRKKRFGLGPMVGYDFISMRLVLGVSLNYSLIQF